MKPRLDQLKSQRECDRQFAEYHQRTADERRRAVSDLDAQIAAEEEREAKAKEWPQEGDQCWWLDSQGSVTETTSGNGWKAHILAMGLLFRTRADAELVRDFLRSRPRGWLLAMAKLGNAFSVWKSPDGIRNSGDAVNLSSTYEIDKWNALTDDERAALLGQATPGSD